MARAILTILLVVLLQVFVGCAEVDTGRSQLRPRQARDLSAAAAAVRATEPAEVDIVEQVAINRQAYRSGLEMLIKYYTETGNNLKLDWAEKELAALDGIPQYKYIIEASMAGPDLKATEGITAANDLYYDAWLLEEKAGNLLILKDDNLLRVALDKYNELIKKYPSSDKIDDAAYRAAQIYQHFKDYTIAVLYYQRVFQWDPETVYPARYKAAYILDRKLHRRADALELYQQALEKDTLTPSQKEFAKRRIAELTKAGETL